MNSTRKAKWIASLFVLLIVFVPSVSFSCCFYGGCGNTLIMFSQPAGNGRLKYFYPTDSFKSGPPQREEKERYEWTKVTKRQECMCSCQILKFWCYRPSPEKPPVKPPLLALDEVLIVRSN